MPRIVPGRHPERSDPAGRAADDGDHRTGRRDEERARLERLVATTRAGDGSGLRSAVLVGDPGSGKSTLLDHTATLGREAGLRVLTARGTPHEHDVAHSCLHRLLRPVLPTAAGLGPLTEHVAREIRAAGVRPGSAVAGDLVTGGERPVEMPTDLTPQQRQIVLLAARGLTDREIGEQLFLSPRTVGFNLTRCSRGSGSRP